MCLPALAVPLAIAAGVTQAAGQVMQGAQAKAQSKYEAHVAEQNAAMEVEAAHDSVVSGQGEREKFWRGVAATKGAQIASMAANGIEVDTGSAARLSSDTQLLANDDAKSLYKNIEQRTRGHVINANNYVQEAKAAKIRGKNAMTNAILGAAGTLMGTASQAAGLKAKMGAH